MTALPDPRSSNERYWGLDALRGSMMLLGIVLHAATMHLLETATTDTELAVPIVTVLGIIHQFRMPLFFMLAGLFMALLVQKYDVRGAMENRTKRILLPFLFCLVTFVPLTDWLFFSLYLSGQQEAFALIGPNTDFASLVAYMRENNGPLHLTLFHVWFLYYLIIYIAAVPLLDKAVKTLDRRGHLARIRNLVESPWTGLPLCAVLTALTLIPFTAASVAINDRLFVPTLAALIYYGLFFALGYLFFHCRNILDTFREHTGTYGILAFVFFIWFAIPASMDGAGSTSIAVAVVSKLFAGLSTWCFIYWLCGLFLNRFNEDTPRTRLLAQSAYWVYLLHMPVILLVGNVLMNLPVDIGAYARLFINMAVTTYVCFGTYRLLVRATWLGELLNGRRYDTNGRALSGTHAGWGQSKTPTTAEVSNKP
jgi:glucan biosynthesis protein C